MAEENQGITNNLERNNLMFRKPRRAQLQNKPLSAHLLEDIKMKTFMNLVKVT